MAYYDGSHLILEGAELDAFLEQMRHPDPNMLQQRDAYFAYLDQLTDTEYPDGSIEVEFTPKRRPHTRSGQTSAFYSPAEAFEVELRTPHSQPLQTNWNFGPGALSAA